MSMAWSALCDPPTIGTAVSDMHNGSASVTRSLHALTQWQPKATSVKSNDEHAPKWLESISGVRPRQV